MNTSVKTSPLRAAHHERGAALITALFCALIVGLAATTVATMIGQEIQMNKRLCSQASAKTLAAGGIERVLAWSANWCTQNPSSAISTSTINASSACNGNLADGSYSVTASNAGTGPNGETRIQLLSTGTTENGVQDVCRAYVLLPINSLPALAYGIYALGSIGSNGNGSYTVGVNSTAPKPDMYAGLGLNVTGKGFYGGKAATPAGQTANVTLKSGTVDSSAPVIPRPTLNRTKLLSGVTKQSSFPAAVYTAAGYTPSNNSAGIPVLWIEASSLPSFQGNSNGTLKVNGVLVVTGGGSIDFRGNGNLQIGTSSLLTTPALVVLDGGTVSITGNAGSYVKGTIFTDTGNVSFSGTSGLRANVISGGSIAFNGGGNGDFVSAWGATSADYFVTNTKMVLLYWEQ
jgi:Tfp pilus assembly protein PilX